MERGTVIWVDLQKLPATVDYSALVGRLCPILKIREVDKVANAIRTLAPPVVLFEYDAPSADLLEPLKRLASDFPDSRFVMITEQHSECLAIWALRARLWDYLVKPIELPYLLSCIEAPLKREGGTTAESKYNDRHFGQRTTPDRGRRETFGVGFSLTSEHTSDSGESRLTPALIFVKTNYAEKVTLGAVAKLCGLGRYQFSRAFKQAHGTTFREFVIIHRIQKAEQMLCFANVSVTDVAFSVGFNDLSHFAQMFRRYVGVRPSEYVQGTNKRATQMHVLGRLPAEIGAMQNFRSESAKES